MNLFLLHHINEHTEIRNPNARILPILNSSLLYSYIICITFYCYGLDQFSLEHVNATVTFHFGIDASINYSTPGNQTITDTLLCPQSAHTSPIKPHISINSRGSLLDIVFGRLYIWTRLRRLKLLRKESRKAHDMIRASSGHTALSTQHCKSDQAPASIGSKVLQPPGAKSCWIGILQKQVNFVPAGFVLLWVYHLFPLELAQKMEAAKIPQHVIWVIWQEWECIFMLQLDQWVIWWWAALPAMNVAPPTKKEGTLGLRTDWKRESKLATIILCCLILSPRFWQRNTVLWAFMFQWLQTHVQIGNNSTFRLQQNILLKIAHLAAYIQVS